jgi:predicted transcriptional regulator
MQVSEVMNRHCETVPMNESLKTAAAHMREADIGMLLVEDGSGKISGIVTDRDLAVRGLADGKSPDSPVRECMSSELIACHAEDDLEQAAQLMEREQVRRLLVRDADERPVGVLAQADVARALGRSGLAGEVVEKISQPSGKHSQH